MDLNTVITEFDLKTLGFLVYPDDYDEQANPFDFPMKRVLLDIIIPLTSAYFASFFSAYGFTQHVYCQCYNDFVKVQMKNFHWILAPDGASHWNLSSGDAGRSVVLSCRTISPCLES
jgi:hypothetical protein